MPRTFVPEEQKRVNDLTELKDTIRPTPERVVTVESDADGLPNKFYWEQGADAANADGVSAIESNISLFADGGSEEGLWRRIIEPITSQTATTDDLTEGENNLYFTRERVEDDVNDLLTEGNNVNLTYTDNGTSAGSLEIAAVTNIDVDDGGGDVTAGIDNLNFGPGLTVTDNTGTTPGKVTIDALEATSSVSNDGTEVVGAPSDINFTADFAVTNPSGEQVDVDLANDTVTVAGNSVSLGGSTAVAAGDLSDVGDTTQTDGNALVSDGSNFVSEPLSTAVESHVGLTDLSDVGTDADSRPQLPELPSVSTNTSPGKASDLTTKAYVDGVAQGLEIKDSVDVASTGNIDLTSTTDPNPIDGETLSDGEFILLKDQNTASENGIYVANTAADPSTWTRREDFDEDGDIVSGAVTFVESGTENGDVTFIVTSDDPITVDTDDVIFSIFARAGTLNAGDGLVQDGQTFDVSLTVQDSGTNAINNSSNFFGFNFTDGLDVTDTTADGTAVVSASAAVNSKTNISQDESQVVQSVDDINFVADPLKVTDDGDGSVTVDFDGVVIDDMGQATFSGDGSTEQFNIPHSLGTTPSSWMVDAVTDDASTQSHTTADASSLTVTYDTPPPSGSNNLTLNYIIQA